MTDRQIAEVTLRVDPDRLATDLRYLCADPLTRRTVNSRLADGRSTLAAADDYLAQRCAELGDTLLRETHSVQAYRCDPSKPKAHQY